MKKVIFLLVALACYSPIFSQSASQENETLSNNILTQKSYHIDLSTYAKAKLIVDRLISETSLSEQEIIEMLDEMVESRATVTRQFLEKFDGLPTYIDTGNPELDKENYKNAKNSWVENNPVKYQELINSNKPLK